MLELGRYPTPDEVDVLIARARRMRSEYVAALVMSAALRVKQFLARAGDRRATRAQRFFPDIG